MARRLTDIVIAALVLVFFLPLLLLIALIIKQSDPGPVFYKARRAGMMGVPFPLLKFRSMRIGSDRGSAITSPDDQRVFGFGHFLRKSKLDELPQFWNVLKGEMSIFGPRPESVAIVEAAYGAEEWKTLGVLPGVVGPGSLFNYTHADKYLDAERPEQSYIEQFMPVKLALDRVYLDRRDFFYDCRLLCRTLGTIVAIICGKSEFEMPIEYSVAVSEGLINDASTSAEP